MKSGPTWVEVSAPSPMNRARYKHGYMEGGTDLLPQRWQLLLGCSNDKGKLRNKRRKMLQNSGTKAKELR